MMLTTVIDAYVAKQRSLGMRFESGDVVLRRFCRATAAVHRVIAWYRSGQDVQRLLPNSLPTLVTSIFVRPAVSADDAGSPPGGQWAFRHLRDGGRP